MAITFNENHEAYYKKVGSNIRFYRNMKFMSQKDLAEKIGFERRSVQRWEHGASGMTLYALKRMSDVLNVDIKKLLE